MARCGGSSSGARIISGDGITITGYGSLENPYKVSLTDPLTGPACDNVTRCVGSNLGRGLSYNPTSGEISVKISGDAGNGLTWGTDNGLFGAAGGSGGEAGYATVDGLLASPQKIVGGTYGAGYAMSPEGPLAAYRHGMDNELRLLHVPVRRTTDYFLVAAHHRTLNEYAQAQSPEGGSFYGGKTIDGLDLPGTERIWYTPGGTPEDDPVYGWRYPRFSSKRGYFGFGARDSIGMPLLSDVLSLTQRRVVLYLQVKDVGASAGDTAQPYFTWYALRNMVQLYGLTKSVIVGTELPTTASQQDANDIVSGMVLLEEIGVHVALHINTLAQMGSAPPANLVSLGFKWVMIDANLADQQRTRVKAYKDAGLNVMLHSANRQWQYKLTKNTDVWGADGLRGILSPDPVYAAGEDNDYLYYDVGTTLDWTTPNYGIHAYGSTMPWMRDVKRGYVPVGRPGWLTLDGDALTPRDAAAGIRESGYMILQGEMSPVGAWSSTVFDGTKSDNYEIHVGVHWDNLVADRGRWISVFFGVPEDRELYEWHHTNSYTKGYQLALSQNGTFALTRWDGIPYPGQGSPYQWVQTWPSGFGDPVPTGGLTECRFKIEVKPTGISVARIVNGGEADRRDFGGPDATMWRGPYWYLGRHFFFTSDSTTVSWIWPLARPL